MSIRLCTVWKRNRFLFQIFVISFRSGVVELTQRNLAIYEERRPGADICLSPHLSERPVIRMLGQFRLKRTSGVKSRGALSWFACFVSSTHAHVVAWANGALQCIHSLSLPAVCSVRSLSIRSWLVDMFEITKHDDYKGDFPSPNPFYPSGGCVIERISQIYFFSLSDHCMTKQNPSLED